MIKDFPISNRSKILGVLFLAALGVKLIVFFGITEPVVFLKYPLFAQRISEGGDIGERLLDISPLYLYVNVLFYKIYGENWEALALLQAIIGSFTVLLIYGAAEKLLGRGVAVLSAVLLILYGNLTLLELTLEPEVFVLFFNALGVFLLLKARDPAIRPAPWMWLAAGAVFGLSVITKPNGLLLIPVALAWIWWKESPIRLKVQASIGLLLGLSLIVSPVTLRNYIRFHDLVWITADGGKVFYHGNGPGATGMERADLPEQGFREEGQTEPDYAHVLFRKTARELTGQPLTPSQCSAFWVSRTLDHIGNNAGSAIFLVAKKFFLFWDNYEVHDISPNYKSYTLMQALPLIPYGWLSALGLIGMILLRKRFNDLFLLYSLVGTYLVSVLIFFAASRYRLPAVPFLAIFAAFTVQFVFLRLRMKDFRAAITVALSAMLIFLSSHIPLRQERLQFDRWQRATRLHYTMGGCLPFKQGLYAQAIPELEKAIQLAPGFAPAYNRLGMCYAIVGDWEKAERNFQKVIELAPTIDQGYANLGILYYLKNEADRAIPLLQKALSLNPENLKARDLFSRLNLSRNGQ